MEFVKNYDPNYSYGTHKVEVTLQAWDYRTTLVYEMGGNCKGLSILNIDIDEVLEQIGFYNDEDENYCVIHLRNENGDDLEFEIFEASDLENIIVGLKIVDFIEREE